MMSLYAGSSCMSYCSAMARIGSWKMGSAVTSGIRRPPRYTHGAFFLSDSTYACPLRAGMVAVPFSPVHPLPTTLADRLPDCTPPPNPNREAHIPYLRSFLLAVLTAGLRAKHLPGMFFSRCRNLNGVRGAFADFRNFRTPAQHMLLSLCNALVASWNLGTRSAKEGAANEVEMGIHPGRAAVRRMCGLMPTRTRRPAESMWHHRPPSWLSRAGSITMVGITKAGITGGTGAVSAEPI